VALVDLDNEDQADPGPCGPETAIAFRRKPLNAKEDEYYDKLTAKLLNCSDCPHSHGSYCLKAPNGAHVRFSTHLILTWARAWACNIFSIFDMEN
jgi:hypothetical protein